MNVTAPKCPGRQTFLSHRVEGNMAHQTHGGAMDKSHIGTCFCGAVTVEVTGAPLEMGYCHCSSCRAYSGAPVNASSMQTSLFRLFTCIKVSDSVQDGLSYFYAEVKRLQALLAATKSDDALPVLFLIDEIFRDRKSVV